MRTFVAYVPVLHEGYLRFFEKYEGPKKLAILGKGAQAEFRWLAKDIRQVDPALMKKVVEALGIFDEIVIVENIKDIAKLEGEIVMSDEDISHEIANTYLQGQTVIFDSIFLRWDKHNSIAERPIVPDEQITHDEFHQRIIHDLKEEAKKSPDNWRHVAAAIVKDGEVISHTYNTHHFNHLILRKFHLNRCRRNVFSLISFKEIF